MGKNSGGDVEYILRADDSKLESDMKKANRKVEQAAEKSADQSVKIEKQKTENLKQESNKVVRNAEKAAEDVADAWKDAGQDAQKAMDKIGDGSGTVDVKVKADNSSAKREIEELADIAEDVGEEIEDSLGGDGSSLVGNLGSTMKASFEDAASGMIPFSDQLGSLTAGLSSTQIAAVGVGAAAVGVGVMGVSAFMDIDTASNQLQASLGATDEDMEQLRGVMENIYNNNYGDSFGDIADALGNVKKNLGDLDDESLQKVTESAFALRDTFGYDIPESTRSAKAMMDNFGISGEEAMNLIASGAQNGLDFSGELIDSINEYSVHFAKAGLDANDMFAIFQKGSESGAFNLDKIGDAVKEMSIRVIDGSDATKEGFASMGLNADEMAQKFAAGGESAKEAFNQTIDALAAMEDPLAQNAAGVAIFGTMWEDLGPEVVTALADIEEGSYDAADAMDQLKETKYDDLGSQFEELKRNVETALIPIGEALMPLLMELAEVVFPLVSSCLVPVIQAFADFISLAVVPVVSAISTLLVPLVTGAMESLSGTVTGVIGNLTAIFRNLIDFIKNVFTGNWKAAWNNVKNIFSNAVSGLYAIFKAPLNAVVDGWNSLASSIGSISVPDWVPIAGGKTFSLPRMNRLKVGLDYVPSDMYPAYLDEGEWVLTKEEANLLRSLGGLEGLAARTDRLSSGSPVTVSVQGQNIDYALLGKAVAQALIHSNVTFKCDMRTFAYLVEEAGDYV